MLQSRNLDDLRYDDIVRTGMNRLPLLCPDWTNYNPADPGVTIIELFAWYQEMQRFHLNQVTKPLRRAILKTLGQVPREAQAAHCLVEVPPMDGYWVEGTQLNTEGGVVFELEETVGGDSTMLQSLFLVRKGQKPADVTELLNHADAVVQPFFHGNQPSAMEIYLEGGIGEQTRLWFEVDEGTECPRNAFKDAEQAPRTIRWLWNGEQIDPMYDETHALSTSGFICLPTEPGERGVLRAELTDPGCEETVRLKGIFCRRHRAVQKQTRGKVFKMTVPAGKDCQIEIMHALARMATATLLIRTERGWMMINPDQEMITPFGEKFAVDTSSAVNDGQENLMIIYTDQKYYDEMVLSTKGLPNEEILLQMDEKKPVGDFTLLCLTRQDDGSVSPELWHRVPDVSVCGPRDRVFSYDEVRQELYFGDGKNGEMLVPAQTGILVADLAVSECAEGNIPGGDVLFKWRGDGTPIRCTDAKDGANAETIEETEARFLRSISKTRKCATMQDFCDIARATPGLRVATVKAIPGHDPSDMNGRVSKPVVSVVVVPYSQNERPVPDRRFLDAVYAELDRYRPICTKVAVLPPRYVGISVQARVRVQGTVDEEAAREALSKWFSLNNSKRSIGDKVNQNEVTMCLQSIPGIVMVNRVRIFSRSPGCRLTIEGDMEVPVDAVAWMEDFRLEMYE